MALGTFEKQMAILAHRWKPVSLLDLVSWIEGKMSLPRRAVVVTFDDGTEDNFTHAFPILSKYRIPATIFLSPGSITFNTLKLDQIIQMHDNGITFGSHTYSHRYLPSLSLEQVHQELRKSKEWLEKLIRPIEFLSYPAGGFTSEIVTIARKVGYRAACTTNRGLKRHPINPWALRRLTMHNRATSSFGMFIRCSGYYGINRRIRHSHQDDGI
ncbi:MAG: polysaccharide deacetylase family protein [Candidatus Omnitrophica bacterium]|nr:polysaccharide deacetylase family protein [Candidatus Omnitrophota bacterium]